MVRIAIGLIMVVASCATVLLLPEAQASTATTTAVATPSDR